MTEARFIEKNEKNWNALEAYNRQNKKRLASEDVREFARLFRLVSHHHAYAKTHFPQGKSLAYLNGLVGVSHNYFYVRKKGSFSEIKEYFTNTFPYAVRETWVFWVVASAFFALGAVFAGLYVYFNPSRLQDISPMFYRFQEGYTPYFGDGGVDWDYALMTAVIGTNNIMVSFNAFALGLLGGLGSVFILVYNGLIVGGLMGFFHQSGADMVTAYALILPHGVLELMAIFLSGGGGLMLGKALLIPGELSRKQALVVYGKKAAKLIPGIVVLLIITAVIEGFFTPLAIAPWIKLTFAAFSGWVFFIYCRFKVRENEGDLLWEK